MPSPLHARFGRVGAQGTLVTAAILAADGASSVGFRLADVQFFFFLFGNWLERDVLRAGDTLELTQVRRALRRLVDEQWARVVRLKGRKAPRHALTSEGVDGLASHLVELAGSRSFEETVFVVTFVACYGEAILARASKRLRERLRPRPILAAAKQRTRRVLADLEERIRSSAEVATAAAELRRAGCSDGDVAAQLEGAGAYQLQHVRSFGGFILSLPDELRRFELGPAFATRSELLFVTFAEQARAQLAILERLEERLG